MKFPCGVYLSTVFAVAMSITATPALADGTCVLTCPANMTVASLPGGVAIPVNYTVTSTGFCGSTAFTPGLPLGVYQTSGLPTGSAFPVGTVYSAFRADDPPQQTCSFSVTVTDTPALPISIPTLSEWGLIILSGLTALATFVSMRRRKA